MPFRPTVRPSRLTRFPLGLLAGLFLVAALAPAAVAQRQTSMEIFPHDTLLFVRTNNAKEFVERLKDTSTGRLLADPEIKPIVDRVLGESKQLYAEQAEQIVGVPIDELLKLPAGEVAFGVVARNGPPAMVLLIDEAGERSAAQPLLDRAIELLKQAGADFTKETIDSVEITVARLGSSETRQLGFFQKDGTLVASNEPNVLRHILWHWDGSRELPATGAGEATSAAGAGGAGSDDDQEFVPGPALDDNERFAAILRDCRRPQDPPPNLIFYVDPIGLIRQFGRANPGVQAGLAFLPQLGLDGVQGVGGAYTFSTGQYEALTHLHVLLDNPRSGVLSLISFDSGDTKPQPWVPLDSASYMTLHWNFQAFYNRLAAIVDRFRGEGAFDEFIADGPAAELGIDFKTEIVGNLAGRVTWVQAFQKPASIRSGQHVLAFELVNEELAKRTLQTFMNRAGDEVEKRQFGPVTYHAIGVRGFEEMPEDERPMLPFVAIMDKQFFIGTSYKVFEQMILASQGDAKRLVDSDDYAQIDATISKETVGMRPVIVAISRPVVTWQFYYDLVTSDGFREMIEQGAAEEPAVERFAAILRESRLPPFETLAKYFGPAGGILYDTDNGFHGISFQLRGEQ